MEEVLSQATPSSTTRTAAVVFAGFCAFVTLFAPQPLLPMLAREFRVSAGAISLVVTASTLAVAMAAPFAGVVADRFGRKRVIVPAAFLLAAPTLRRRLRRASDSFCSGDFCKGCLRRASSR